MKNWIVVQDRFDTERTGHWASVFTVSNGYFGTRGVDEESSRGMPSTYIAGTFTEDFIGVDMLPNTPNWLITELEVDGELFDIEKHKLLEYRREYNLQEGVLYRNLQFESAKGKITAIRSERFASQDDRHLGVMKYCVTPVNYSGKLIIRTGFDCDARFRDVNYLKTLSRESMHNGISLCSETTESHIIIAETALTSFHGTKASTRIIENGDRIFVEYSFDAEEGKEYELHKFLSVFTSRDGGQDISRQATVSAECSLQKGYKDLKDAHISEWRAIWRKCDIIIEGDDFSQLAIRFCMFHLISGSNPYDDKVSLAAKLLSGDFYRHHVFWDTDLFMMPFFTSTLPERARNMVMYRYHTLDGARRKASEEGYKGAWYPWESSDTGYEVSPKQWIDDDGVEHPISCWKYEIHSVCDVAFAVWDYVVATGDRQFLYDHGFEILFETARFWVSRAELDEGGELMSIRHVTGPDEYHPDVDNSAYINYLAKWNIRKAVQVFLNIKDEAPEFLDTLSARLKITKDELEKMKLTASSLRIPYDKIRQLYTQFEGFEQLKPDDPKDACKRYPTEEDITPMQIVKQSDVIMLMYLFRDITPIEVVMANWGYYVPKTEHNSSLSACTHCIIASLLGKKDEAWDYFMVSASADLKGLRSDTEHGIHAAAMGGTWKAVVFGFAGVIYLEDRIRINPTIPDKWHRLCINLMWRGVSFTLDITPSSFKITNNSPAKNLVVESGTTEYIIEPKGRQKIELSEG